MLGQATDLLVCPNTNTYKYIVIFQCDISFEINVDIVKHDVSEQPYEEIGEKHFHDIVMNI